MEWEEWECFFGVLQQRAPEAQWGLANNPRGGELVAWWCRNEVGDGNEVYLQIHKKREAGCDGEHFLAFRVSTPCKDNNYRRGLLICLTKLLMQVVVGHGWGHCVAKPRRYGYGETMNFGVTTDQSC